MPISKIKETKPSFSEKSRITDDTQMSLYAIDSLYNLKPTLNKLNDRDNLSFEEWNDVSYTMASGFVKWLNDPRNNRFPGETCMSSLAHLNKQGTYRGFEGSVLNSKGCGANMRNPWFGLLPYSDATIEKLSLIQAAITHGHPLALSSSVLTALTVKAINNGEVIPGEDRLYNWVSQKIKSLLADNQDSPHISPEYNERHNHFWLSLFDSISGEDSSALRKWKELRKYSDDEHKEFSEWFPFYKNYVLGLVELDRYWHSSKTRNGKSVKNNLKQLKLNKHDNLCQAMGAEGWVAEEALLLAVAATDEYVDNPEEGLRQLVHTSGDSDSIAAIGGAMLGASAEKSFWDNTWLSYIEYDYKDELDKTLVHLATWDNRL